MKIAILLFEEVDLLDVGGPYEVLLTASRLIERDGGTSPFNITTISIDDKPVTCFGGMGLIPSSDFAQGSQADVLIVPGTIDINKASMNQALIKAISDFARQDKPERVVASVCTGAFLLAKARLLDNRKWTTHFEDIDLLTETLGSNSAMQNMRWVDSGSVVTSGGLSAGIDMALHLVERFHGLDLAQKTAKQIEYAWNKAGHSEV